MTWYEAIKSVFMVVFLVLTGLATFRLYNMEQAERSARNKARREATNATTEAWMSLWRDEKRGRLQDIQARDQRIADLEEMLRKSEEQIAALNVINGKLWDDKASSRRA